MRILISLPRSAPRMAACLRIPSGDRNRPRYPFKGFEIDSNHPVSDGIANFAPARIIEPQANISHRAAIANFLELFRREDIATARDQEGGFYRSNPNKRDRQSAEQAGGLPDMGIL